jgi:hypothetical protein
MEEFENIGDDDWDQDFADDIVGCTLLVGITYVDYDDSLIRRQQVFGTVQAIDRKAGITIAQLPDGEPFTIAPVLDAIAPGDPGVYQLSDADEEVEDPDFTALLTVRSPHRS